MPVLVGNKVFGSGFAVVEHPLRYICRIVLPYRNAGAVPLFSYPFIEELDMLVTNILGTLDKRLELCRKMTASLLKQLDELYDYYFGDVNKAKQNRFGHNFFEILSGYPFDSST